VCIHGDCANNAIILTYIECPVSSPPVVFFVNNYYCHYSYYFDSSITESYEVFTGILTYKGIIECSNFTTANDLKKVQKFLLMKEYNILTHHRNRLCQMHQYLLPVKEEAASRASRHAIDFLKLTEEQIEYMRKNRTTELPPGMFLEHRFGTTELSQKKILQLAYVGFTLTTVFPQNICMLKDGTIIFCHQFLMLPTDSSTSTNDGGEKSDEKPLIAGFKFDQVICHAWDSFKFLNFVFAG